jgi:uncharacterized membrane protein
MKKPFLLIPAIHLTISTLSVCLLAFRIIQTEQAVFLFLAWNLILAWLPFLFATAAFAVRRNGLAAAGFGLLWLLFLPNGPYILTDLIHLRWIEGAPFWYDLSMILCFSLAGLLLGLTSLNLMQTLVRERFGRLPGWLFVIISMGLAGYGVYLGRFLRWNSWDALINPLGLAGDILTMLRYPIQHIESYFITAAFAALLLLAYVTIFSLGSMQKAVASK